MEQKFSTLSEKELEQVTGGMSWEEEATLWGTVCGHVINAKNIADRGGNASLTGKIEAILSLCWQKQYPEAHKAISELTAGVFESSTPEAYKELGLAKKALEDSGVLQE